jgi:hypothetical protein
MLMWQQIKHSNTGGLDANCAKKEGMNHWKSLKVHWKSLKDQAPDLPHVHPYNKIRKIGFNFQGK